MISNAFGLELINLSYLFSTSPLDWSSQNRATMDGLPIIIIGGSNANGLGSIVKFPAAGNPNSNPEEVQGPAEDSFADGIFFGEGEGAVGRLAAILTGPSPDARQSLSSKARKERLLAAAGIQGFWPCLYTGGTKKAIAIKRPSMPRNPLVLNGNAALEVKLAITAGCPGYCSFCLEGWDRRPYQEGDLDHILADARELRAKTGADTLEVYSYNFNTHARIFDLLFELNRIFPHVSFMSQRVDILAKTRGLFEAELAAGKRSFTFGIEGISARMRAFYHKGIKDEDIESCIDKALAGNVRELKLFFIIAGMEEAQDLEEFSTLIRHIAGKKRATMASTRVLVSAGFLVRLPFTPLQYAPLDFDANKLSGLDSALSTACEANGVEYRTATTLDEYFVDQTISSAGDRILPWLAATPGKGFVFDSKISRGTWKSLREYCESLHHPGPREDGLVEKFPEMSRPQENGAGKGGFFWNSEFVAEKSKDFRPPLAFIEGKEFWSALYRQFLTSKSFIDREPCLGGRCLACGGCESPDQKRFMTDHRFVLPGSANYTANLARLLAAKAAFKPVFAEAEFPAELAFAHTAYRESWALRALSALVPGAERLVFRVSESLYGANQPFGAMTRETQGRFGLSLLALYGPDEDKLRKLLEMVRTAGAGPSDAGEDSHEARGYTSGNGDRLPVRQTMRAFGVSLKTVDPFQEPRRIEASVEPLNGTLDTVASLVERFFNSLRLNFTKTKTPTGERVGFHYKFPVSQEGKRLFFDATVHQEESKVVFAFSAGNKIDLGPLLDEFANALGVLPVVRVNTLSSDNELLK
jgi:radical SAM superfamily enzyme YgiQ (UPF0313 family)